MSQFANRFRVPVDGVCAARLPEDNESLGYFTAEGKACAAPLAVECRRVSDKKAWNETKNIMTCAASAGALCLNASQPGGITCDDIEVRFLCPKP